MGFLQRLFGIESKVASARRSVAREIVTTLRAKWIDYEIPLASAPAYNRAWEKVADWIEVEYLGDTSAPSSRTPTFRELSKPLSPKAKRI